ncbi:MAG: DNA-directed RNA polymerase subunit omega [Acidobacteriota bacterium]
MIGIPRHINSRFKFVVIAARRAVQLQRGARPKIQAPTTKWTRVAIREVEKGLIKYSEPTTESAPKPKSRSRRKSES